MTIVEAVKSGKPFRRPHWCESTPENKYWIEQDDAGITYMIGPAASPLYAEDILATDWEIKEDRIEITYSLLEQAFGLYVNPVLNLNAISGMWAFLEKQYKSK